MKNNSVQTKVKFKDLMSHKNYLLFFTGQAISQLGDKMTLIAVPLLIYHLTNSPIQLGMAFLIESLPWIFLGPIAGTIIDRFNPIRILVLVDVVRVLLCLTLFMTDSIVMIYAIGLLSQTCSCIFAPARSAIFPDLTGKKLFNKGLTLSLTTGQLIDVLGPSIATLCISIFHGPRFIFVIDAVTFIISAVLTSLIVLQQASIQKQNSSFQSRFKEGYRFINKNKKVKFLLIIGLIRTIATSAIPILLLLQAKYIFGNELGDRYYGFLISAVAFGIVTGSWIIGIIDRNTLRKNYIIFGIMVQSIIYAIIYYTDNIEILLGLFFLSGVATSGTLTPVSSFYAEYIPREIRGRVFSAINSILQIMGMIVYFTIGFFAEFIQPNKLLLGIGCLMTVSILLMTWIFKGWSLLRNDEENKSKKIVAN
ncbi:hypothetical protein COE50_25370 [Bacillus anthracis]|uniref:MFS transporter n=1 Tax=Bacillus tropicus TaxID=2026188 RepID=UPI000BF78539|nr:hypothetical protein COK10_22615 [Bacillus anthracis]PGZ27911.1 hypothetical protein COE50_25370 [Bacillus anthracis]